MTTADPKDVEHTFNSMKRALLEKSLNHALQSTRKLTDKTKDKDIQSAVRIADSGSKLVAAKQKVDSLPGKQLPDIHIKGGTTPINEPSVTIRGIYGDDRNKAYPGLIAKTHYVPFLETEKEIHVMFETKNVKLDGGGYRYLIVAKEEKGKFFRRILIRDNNKFDQREPNILEDLNKNNERLPPAKYDLYVWLLENNSNKSILNSKGEKVLDYARIEIKPSKTSNDTTTGKNPDPTKEHDDKGRETRTRREITEGERKKRGLTKRDIDDAKIVPHKKLEEASPQKLLTTGGSLPLVKATPIIEITMYETISGDKPQPLTFTVHNANLTGRINFDYTIDIFTLENPLPTYPLENNKPLSHDYGNLFHEESSKDIKRTDIDLSRINPQFDEKGFELPKLIILTVRDNNTGHVATVVKKILVAHSIKPGAKLD